MGFSFEDYRESFLYFLSVLIFIARLERASTCPLFRTRCFNFIPVLEPFFSLTRRSSLTVRPREANFRSGSQTDCLDDFFVELFIGPPKLPAIHTKEIDVARKHVQVPR